MRQLNQKIINDLASKHLERFRSAASLAYMDEIQPLIKLIRTQKYSEAYEFINDFLQKRGPEITTVSEAVTDLTKQAQALLNDNKLVLNETLTQNFIDHLFNVLQNVNLVISLKQTGRIDLSYKSLTGVQSALENIVALQNRVEQYFTPDSYIDTLEKIQKNFIQTVSLEKAPGFRITGVTLKETAFRELLKEQDEEVIKQFRSILYKDNEFNSKNPMSEEVKNFLISTLPKLRKIIESEFIKSNQKDDTTITADPHNIYRDLRKNLPNIFTAIEPYLLTVEETAVIIANKWPVTLTDPYDQHNHVIDSLADVQRYNAALIRHTVENIKKAFEEFKTKNLVDSKKFPEGLGTLLLEVESVSNRLFNELAKSLQKVYVETAAAKAQANKRVQELNRLAKLVGSSFVPAAAIAQGMKTGGAIVEKPVIAKGTKEKNVSGIAQPGKDKGFDQGNKFDGLIKKPSNKAKDNTSTGSGHGISPIIVTIGGVSVVLGALSFYLLGGLGAIIAGVITLLPAAVYTISQIIRKNFRLRTLLAFLSIAFQAFIFHPWTLFNVSQEAFEKFAQEKGIYATLSDKDKAADSYAANVKLNLEVFQKNTTEGWLWGNLYTLENLFNYIPEGQNIDTGEDIGNRTVNLDFGNFAQGTKDQGVVEEK